MCMKMAAALRVNRHIWYLMDIQNSKVDVHNTQHPSTHSLGVFCRQRDSFRGSSVDGVGHGKVDRSNVKEDWCPLKPYRKTVYKKMRCTKILFTKCPFFNPNNKLQLTHFFILVERAPFKFDVDLLLQFQEILRYLPVRPLLRLKTVFQG